MAKLVDVPFVIADATSLTQAGYVGDDVESILFNLYKESGYVEYSLYIQCTDRSEICTLRNEKFHTEI